MIRSSLACAVGVWLALAMTAQAGGRTQISIGTADGPREAVVFANRPGPQPTVIVLHGATTTAEQTIRFTGFAEAAERHGFNAVFPNGLGKQWNDGRVNTRKPDDVAFLRALVARIISDHIAPPRKVYLAGISNGGMMTFTMACRAGDLFAGFGTIIASLPANDDPCPLKPAPLLMINGTADPLVPYEGGSVGFFGGRGDVLGAEPTAAIFARADGCGVERHVDMLHRNAADVTRVTRIDRADCNPGLSVTLYRVEGGGHEIPGRPAFAPRLLGAANQDISSVELILSMFAAHAAR